MEINLQNIFPITASMDDSFYKNNFFFLVDNIKNNVIFNYQLTIS